MTPLSLSFSVALPSLRWGGYTFTRIISVLSSLPPSARVHAGFWAVQNFVRPLRISLALALAPAFDKAITQLGEKLNIPKGW